MSMSEFLEDAHKEDLAIVASVLGKTIAEASFDDEYNLFIAFTDGTAILVGDTCLGGVMVSRVPAGGKNY